MKPVYSTLFTKKGNYTGGIVRINVAPREWLSNTVAVDFESNKITELVTLIAGKQWISLNFNMPTYIYDEKPKITKSGSYYDISIAGILNNLNALSQGVLDTLRYHELVAVLTDRYKRQRIVGNKDTGLVLQNATSLKNSPVGQEQVALELTMQYETPSPFVDDAEYIPLPTEEDILLTSDDDFLLYD